MPVKFQSVLLTVLASYSLENVLSTLLFLIGSAGYSAALPARIDRRDLSPIRLAECPDSAHYVAVHLSHLLFFQKSRDTFDVIELVCGQSGCKFVCAPDRCVCMWLVSACVVLCRVLLHYASTLLRTSSYFMKDASHQRSHQSVMIHGLLPKQLPPIPRVASRKGVPQAAPTVGDGPPACIAGGPVGWLPDVCAVSRFQGNTHVGHYYIVHWLEGGTGRSSSLHKALYSSNVYCSIIVC